MPSGFRLITKGARLLIDMRVGELLEGFVCKLLGDIFIRFKQRKQ